MAPRRRRRGRTCRTTSTRWCSRRPTTTRRPSSSSGGVTLPSGQTGDKDLSDALDNIFNHANVGPFVSLQLIHSLVTSNPSPGYVAARRDRLRRQRLGRPRRPEGRGPGDPDGPRGAAGTSRPTRSTATLKEPVLFVLNLLRAFNARSADGAVAERRLPEPQTVLDGPGRLPAADGLQLLPGGLPRARDDRRPRARSSAS